MGLNLYAESSIVRNGVNRNSVLLALSVVALVTGSAIAAPPGDDDDSDAGAMVTLLPAAKVTLQQGLAVAQAQGQPISGTFEVDDGQFQLSVYTVRAGKFSEVVVDVNTGAVRKYAPLSGGQELATAASEAEVVTKAKKSLTTVVDDAEHTMAGFRAVSVMPAINKGHAVAIVTLVNGADSRWIAEPLE